MYDVKKQYAVIGLGRFGSSVACCLWKRGNEVLAIDLSEERIDDAKDFVTHSIIADSTEEESLKSVGIRNFDCVIVAIGNDLQASILTVLVLKEMGVQKVIAKALNKRHGQVLEKLGADWVIYPERDMGEKVAHQLMTPNVLNFIEVSKDYSIEEIIVPSNMAGKTLKDLDFRSRFNITIIAINSNGVLNISPAAEQVIHDQDVLIVIGHKKDLNSLSH